MGLEMNFRGAEPTRHDGGLSVNRPACLDNAVPAAERLLAILIRQRSRDARLAHISGAFKRLAMNPSSVFSPRTELQRDTLIALGRWLKEQGYRHICTTPETHQRLLRRRQGEEGRTLADAFGWNLGFASNLLPASWLPRLVETGIVVLEGGQYRSLVRFSSLTLGANNVLLAHSAFPTANADAVFFGPDSYRFAAAIRHAMGGDFHTCQKSNLRAIELCSGAGPGALALLSGCGGGSISELHLTDLNPKALAYAQINCQLFTDTAPEVIGKDVVQLRQGDLFGYDTGTFDFIVANPPYLSDAARRTYRHGGERLGTDLAVRIASESLPRLNPEGRLVLYTGAPSQRGCDLFLLALQPFMRQPGFRFDYEEIDPDVFGEELDQPAYAEVERIAAVAFTAIRLG